LLPIATGRRLRAVLGELLRPHRARAALALIALVAGAGVSVLTAPLLGRIIDLVAQGEPADTVTGPVLLLVVVALG